MREDALQRLWFAGAMPAELRTLTGERVAVIDPGTWNRGGGPDFLGARLRIGGRTLQGHVEVHCDAADWARHGHDRDPAYGDVILHLTLAGEARTCARHTVRLDPAWFADRGALGESRADPAPGACRPADRRRFLAELREAGRRAIARRADRLHRRAEAAGLPAALLAAIARSLGQPVNGPALERHVRERPVATLDEASQEDAGGERDPSRAEALLLYGSGLPAARDAESRRYLDTIRTLAGATAGGHGTVWQWGGTRPLGSPWRRLAGLASLLDAFGGPTLLGVELERRGEAWLSGGPIRSLLVRGGRGYWARRWRPGAATFPRPAALIGPAQAATVERDVLAPFFLHLALRRGDRAMARRFWQRAETVAPGPTDGILRFTAARVGVPARVLFPTWLHQLGGRWLHRAACGGGGPACRSCPFAR